MTALFCAAVMLIFWTATRDCGVEPQPTSIIAIVMRMNTCENFMTSYLSLMIASSSGYVAGRLPDAHPNRPGVDH